MASTLLTLEETAARLRISVRTLQRHRARGLFDTVPAVPGMRFGPQRVRLRDALRIERFLAAQGRAPRSPAADGATAPLESPPSATQEGGPSS